MSNTVVITSATRTAVGSLGKSLKNIPANELGSSVIVESIKRSKLKPVDIDELNKAIDKHRKSKTDQKSDNFQNLIDNEQLEGNQKKLGIPDANGIMFVKVQNIIRCESDGNYTKIFLNTGKKLLASKTLGEFESMLEGDGFFRIHRSHLINLTHLKKYTKGEHSFVELSDGTKADVSRRKKSGFIDALAELND